MNQPDLFSGGDVLKEDGIERVSRHNQPFLVTIRNIARHFAEVQGQVTIDELRRWAAREGLSPDHPNAWGAVFSEPGWACVGYKQSTVPTNHARLIRIWAWEGAEANG